MSCRVAIEKEHATSRSGRPHRVRLDIKVPPGHEVVIDENTNSGAPEESVDQTLRSAFKRARRKLRDLSAQQREEVKSHPEQATMGIIDKKFEDHGFLRTPEGREIYFHQNSVIHDDFENVHVGDGVHYTEDLGDEGAQASTVRVVDRRGRGAG